MEVKRLIERYTYQERQRYLQLNPDRADVIVPGADIYIKVMQWAGAQNILVPDMGLKDGLLLRMYEHYST